MHDVASLLAAVKERHGRLCPRQVIGVRMALAGAVALRMELPVKNRELMVIAETDGCFLSGLEVAAGVCAAHRTLRIEDYGKVAATFVNVRTGEAARLVPRGDVRERAVAFAPGASSRYAAQLAGYQVMPDEELFSVTPVVLATPLKDIVSRAAARARCASCGEEIINDRQVLVEGTTYCRSCAGPSYFHILT